MICVNKSHDNTIPGKFGLLTTPLQRIVTGTFLVALAFLMSGVLEIELRRGYPEVPGAGQIKLFIHNGLESGCNLQVTSFDENISSQETKYDSKGKVFLATYLSDMKITCCLPICSKNRELMNMAWKESFVLTRNI